MNILMQVVEVREWRKEPELRLRFRMMGKTDKVFAEIPYQEVRKVEALLTDAERWVGTILAKARLQ